MRTHEEVRLAQDEWDFSAVPSAQLAAAEVYELCRESETIRQFHGRSWDKRKSRRRSILIDEDELESSIHQFREQEYQLLEKLSAQTSPVCSNLFSPRWQGVLNRPWQKLTQKERTDLASGYNFSPVLSLPVRAAQPVGLGRFWEQLKEHRPFGRKVLRKFTPFSRETGNVHTISIRDWEFPQARFVKGGVEFIGIALDWQRYRPTEIKKALQNIIDELGPPENIAGPGQRGNDPRVTLDRIGVMRLMAHYKLSDAMLFVQSRERWLFGNKPGSRSKNVARHWRRARSAAIARFHEIFPFLPHEKLISEDTDYMRRGGWQGPFFWSSVKSV